MNRVSYGSRIRCSSLVQPVHQCLAAQFRCLREAVVQVQGPVGTAFIAGMLGFAALHALAAPRGLVFAQGRAFMGRQGTHHVAVEDVLRGVCLLKALHGTCIGAADVAALWITNSTCLRLRLCSNQ